MLHQVEAQLKTLIQTGKLTRHHKDDLRELVARACRTIHDCHGLRAKVFDLARLEIENGNQQAMLSFLEEVTKIIYSAQDQQQKPQVRAYFSPGDHCRAEIIDGLRRAQKQVDICVFTVTDDQITRVVEATHRRGVPIRLITDNDKAFDQGSDIHKLAELGIPVKVDQTRYHMHHKFAIFDCKTLLTGSYNWTRTAASSNQENLLVLEEPKTLTMFQKEFDRLWANQPFLHEHKPSRSKW